jgi:hypothetical protein
VKPDNSIKEQPVVDSVLADLQLSRDWAKNLLKAARKALADAKAKTFDAYLDPNGPTVEIRDIEHLKALLGAMPGLEASLWFTGLVGRNTFDVLAATTEEEATGYQVATLHQGICYVLLEVKPDLDGDEDSGMTTVQARQSWHEERAAQDTEYEAKLGSPDDLAKTTVQAILKALPESRVDLNPYTAREYLKDDQAPDLEYGNYRATYEKAVRAGLESELRQRRKRIIQDLAAKYKAYCAANGVSRPTQVNIKMWLTDTDVHGNDQTVREIRAILTQQGMP